MLHDFMSSVQTAQSKLSAVCTCVEDYVVKMLFVEQYMAKQKALDATCDQVRGEEQGSVCLAACCLDWA
jgi:hypothetical protein